MTYLIGTVRRGTVRHFKMHTTLALNAILKHQQMNITSLLTLKNTTVRRNPSFI